jgi:hypothetical protein
MKSLQDKMVADKTSQKDIEKQVTSQQEKVISILKDVELKCSQEVPSELGNSSSIDVQEGRGIPEGKFIRLHKILRTSASGSCCPDAPVGFDPQRDTGNCAFPCASVPKASDSPPRRRALLAAAATMDQHEELMCVDGEATVSGTSFGGCTTPRNRRRRHYAELVSIRRCASEVRPTTLGSHPANRKVVDCIAFALLRARCLILAIMGLPTALPGIAGMAHSRS